MLLAAEGSKEVFGHRLETAPFKAALKLALDARREQFLNFHVLKKAERFADYFAGTGIAAGFVARF